MDENNNPIRKARSRSVSSKKKNKKITSYFKTNKIQVAIPSEQKLNELSNHDLNKLVDKINEKRAIIFNASKSSSDDIDDETLIKSSEAIEKLYNNNRIEKKTSTFILKENTTISNSLMIADKKDLSIDYSKFELDVSKLIKVNLIFFVVFVVD
jgi:predicted nucleic acid binding AN1-type Zn finger protein